MYYYCLFICPKESDNTPSGDLACINIWPIWSRQWDWSNAPENMILMSRSKVFKSVTASSTRNILLRTLLNRPERIRPAGSRHLNTKAPSLSSHVIWLRHRSSGWKKAASRHLWKPRREMLHPWLRCVAMFGPYCKGSSRSSNAMSNQGRSQNTKDYPTYQRIAKKQSSVRHQNFVQRRWTQ